MGGSITPGCPNISSQLEVFLVGSHLALATFNMGSGCLRL